MPTLQFLYWEQYYKNQEFYEVFKITTNSHVSHILRLASCAAISIVGFWYPLFIAYKYSEVEDNRISGITCFALPLLILAACFSVMLPLQAYSWAQISSNKVALSRGVYWDNLLYYKHTPAHFSWYRNYLWFLLYGFLALQFAIGE